MVEHSDTELEQLMETAWATQDPVERAVAWEHACLRARTESNNDDLAVCLSELVELYLAERHTQAAIVCFDELVELYLNQDLEQRVYFARVICRNFKHIIHGQLDNPDVSVAKLHILLERYRHILERSSNTLSDYYLRTYYVRHCIGDYDGALMAFEQWRSSRPDEHFGECLCSVPAIEAEILNQLGGAETAREVGEAALQENTGRCGEHRQDLEMTLIPAWLRSGQSDKIRRARRIHRKVLRRTLTTGATPRRFVQHFEYYALLIDAGMSPKPRCGLWLLPTMLEELSANASQYDLMLGLAAAAGYLHRVPQQDRRIKLSLSANALPRIFTPALIHPTVAEAAKWCACNALNIAKQYDHRPGLVRPHTVADLKDRIFPRPI
ncbi:hypothetical protein CMUST_03405 [Corynebacterium mustelae]|uniref:Uncharacterized protein n=1 Tax=Corynebacterium mustelae TaxID=571915 RepID=A0A0G3GWU5_9CORY|nr:hypothetical protein [Corynebacterium mustelae]AKK05025.1 hypothetical protein CMUST_03405 [Corynebacterium mustelae]